MTSESEKKAARDRFWDIAQRIGLALIVAIGTMLIGHEIRISTIENNRFTDADARTLEDRMVERIPPQWLREDLTEIKALLRDFDARLRELEKR